MQTDEGVTSQNTGQVAEARRAALQRMGRYAAYTAPTLVALLVAGQAGRGWRPEAERGLPGRSARPATAVLDEVAASGRRV
jgi:hypothetical protein